MDLNFLYEPLIHDVNATYLPHSVEFEWVHEEPARPGLRRDDKPFQPCLTLAYPHAMTAIPGLPSGSDALVNAAISALVANLVLLVQVGEADWLFAAFVIQKRHPPQGERTASGIPLSSRPVWFSRRISGGRLSTPLVRRIPILHPAHSFCTPRRSAR